MVRHFSSTVLAVMVSIAAIAAIRDGANSVLSGLAASLATRSTLHESADPSLVALTLSVSTAASLSGGPATVIAVQTILLGEREINQLFWPTGNPRWDGNRDAVSIDRVHGFL